MRNIMVDTAIAVASGLAANPAYMTALLEESYPDTKWAQDSVDMAEALVERLKRRDHIKDLHPAQKLNIPEPVGPLVSEREAIDNLYHLSRCPVEPRSESMFEEICRLGRNGWFRELGWEKLDVVPTPARGEVIETTGFEPGEPLWAVGTATGTLKIPEKYARFLS